MVKFLKKLLKIKETEKKTCHGCKHLGMANTGQYICMKFDEDAHKECGNELKHYEM